MLASRSHAHALREFRSGYVSMPQPRSNQDHRFTRQTDFRGRSGGHVLCQGAYDTIGGW
jgi:hypothetical protein